MPDKLSLSVTISGLSHLFGGELRRVIEVAERADAAGIDQLLLTDHLVIGPDTDRYPYGRFPFGPEEPWPEPLTLLAAIAARTRRIRLGTGILIAPLRSAPLLAKSLATLDQIAGGRVDAGVGLGWQACEFSASGIPFEGRGARMDDILRACRVLWRDAPASFASESVAFESLHCIPQPVQPGGVPLWLGLAPTPRNVARMVEYGSGWMPILSDFEAVADGTARIREALRQAGRDPSGFGVRAAAPVALDSRGRPDLGATLADLPRVVEAGATCAAFAVAQFARRPEQIDAFLEQLAAAERPPLRAD